MASRSRKSLMAWCSSPNETPSSRASRTIVFAALESFELLPHMAAAP
jgi:hypothetical protein